MWQEAKTSDSKAAGLLQKPWQLHVTNHKREKNLDSKIMSVEGKGALLAQPPKSLEFDIKVTFF
jgi:hypothetical protein